MRPDHRPDENRSVWVTESEPPRTAARLTRRLEAEVAIVGGGFTGASTAWHLCGRKPGLGVVLLEAGLLGQGASGRNGGQVLNWINGVHPATGEEAQRVHAATRQGIDLAESLAKELAPKAFSRTGCLEVYTDPGRADEAARRVEVLRAAGVPASFLPASELAVAGACGAVLDPIAGRLNGFALLQAMRPALIARGAQVHEHTLVLRARRSGGAWVLETPETEVRARALVLATNAYTPALGFFKNGILPLHSHVLATAPIADAEWARAGWGPYGGFTDDLDRIAYACRTPGGRVVFGGGGNAAYDYRFGGSPANPPGVDRAGRFMRGILTRYFPRLASAPVERQWAGTLAITLDRVCSMGVDAERNLYHALGYSGHGVSLALLAGRVLADLYEGNHDAWRAQPFYQKRLLPIPPEPLRWLGYQAYTRLTGRSPRRS
jgi:gamma-glutamylputrescine oxidase